MTTPTPATTVIQALRAYREAVANTAYWEEHGTHGDGRLGQATRDEAKAKVRLLAAISAQ